MVSRLVIRRACCGTRYYDARFRMCYGGNVVSRSGIRRAWIGTLRFDRRFSRCCDGNRISSWC